jgi:hypothetical protein
VCLLHSCHCIISFVLLCAHVFYFTIRNRSEFKFKLESKEFENLKRIVKKKSFSVLVQILGRNPLPAQPAYLPSASRVPLPPELPCASALPHHHHRCSSPCCLCFESHRIVPTKPSSCCGPLCHHGRVGLPPPPQMVLICNDQGFDPLQNPNEINDLGVKSR